MLKSMLSSIPVIFSISLLAQASLIINLNESDSQEIKSNFTLDELDDLKLIITNVNESDNLDEFKLSVKDADHLKDHIKEDRIGSTIEFEFSDIIDEATFDNNDSQNYILLFSGPTSYKYFQNNGLQELSINIQKSKKKEENKNNSNDDCIPSNPLDIQQATIKYVNESRLYKKCFDRKSNLCIEDDIVHVFIDEFGNTIMTGLPSTAKEKYKYQFHLVYENKNCDEAYYLFESDGEYNPQFNIYREDTTSTFSGDTSTSDEYETINISKIDFAVVGPYTSEFDVNIYKISKGKKESIFDATIKVAKLYHATLSSGFLITGLRNPQNIRIAPLNDIQNTLVADDPSNRGVLTALATFYPGGRSFLFPPKGGMFNTSRFGVQIGSVINNKVSENFFAGLSHDFSRGGVLSYGIHYGRRDVLQGFDGFDFGVDVFEQDSFSTNMDWGIGFYLGVAVDLRIFTNLFLGQGQADFMP